LLSSIVAASIGCHGSTGGLCQTNRDCASNSACIDGRCQISDMTHSVCHQDKDCAAGHYCEVSSATCQPISARNGHDASIVVPLPDATPPSSDAEPPDAFIPSADAEAPDAIVHADAMTPPSMDASVSGTVITIAQAIANPSQYASTPVTIADVVVIAASTPYVSATGTSLTLYVQDSHAAGPGLAVYRGAHDTTPLPNVGDLITVSGHLEAYNGVLQLASSSRTGITLSMTMNASGQRAIGGAYPPAGGPIQATRSADYANTLSNNHASQIGNVIVFPGPLTVTNPAVFVQTSRDGGTHPEGFSVTGGLWVDDSLVYRSCIAPLDGGVLVLPNGIRGVWDRYQDYYAGSSANPAPTVPVLYPLECADLMP
jgi:hypothetical protein